MGSWSVQVEQSAVPHNVLYTISGTDPYRNLGSVEDIVRAAQPSSCHRGYLLIVTSVFAVSPFQDVRPPTCRHIVRNLTHNVAKISHTHTTVLQE